MGRGLCPTNAITSIKRCSETKEASAMNSMGIFVSRENKTITVKGRVFNIVHKGHGSWEIHENGQLWGQFVVGAKNGHHWPITGHKTLGSRPAPAVDALCIGLQWVNTYGDDESPH